MKNVVRTLAYVFIFILVFVSPAGFEFPGAKQRAKMPLQVATLICAVGLTFIFGLAYLGAQMTGLL